MTESERTLVARTSIALIHQGYICRKSSAGSSSLLCYRKSGYQIKSGNYVPGTPSVKFRENWIDPNLEFVKIDGLEWVTEKRLVK